MLHSKISYLVINLVDNFYYFASSKKRCVLFSQKKINQILNSLKLLLPKIKKKISFKLHYQNCYIVDLFYNQWNNIEDKCIYI